MKFKNSYFLLSSMVALSALSFGCNDAPKAYPPTDLTKTDSLTEIIVDVKDDLSDQEIDQLGRDFGITLRDNSPEVKGDANLTIGQVPTDQYESIVSRLSRDPRVQVVEKQQELHALWVPNDPDYNKQWHFKTIGAEGAWDKSCGSGVIVAVVDTGVACYDEKGFMKGTDLQGTTCVPGHNFVGKNDLAADDQMHGTHVAGTIAQTTNNGFGVAGLSHCAKIMPVKVLSSSGSGSLADVTEGIRWAADHGAQVINLSLGGGGFSQTGQDAVSYATSKGVVVVAAAGNDRGPVNYPAAYKDAFAVSATDANQNIAQFSSRGDKLAIGAPGTNVLQQTICNNGKNKCEEFIAINGTSMATPHVAAAAALVMSQGITDPQAVKNILQKSADPKDNPKEFGAGILNVNRATTTALVTNMIYRGFALVMSFFLLGYLLKRTSSTKLAFSKEMIPGILISCFGLFPFIYVTQILPLSGAARPFLEALFMHPVAEWDIPFSAGLHQYMPFANALPVIACVALLNINRAKNFVGGFALGTMAYLWSLAFTGDSFFILGATALRVFAMVNAAVCAWVAYTAFLKKD